MSERLMISPVLLAGASALALALAASPASAQTKLSAVKREATAKTESDYSHPFKSIDGSALRVTRRQGWGAELVARAAQAAKAGDERIYGQASMVGPRGFSSPATGGMIDAIFGPNFAPNYGAALNQMIAENPAVMANLTATYLTAYPPSNTGPLTAKLGELVAAYRAANPPSRPSSERSGLTVSIRGSGALPGGSVPVEMFAEMMDNMGLSPAASTQLIQQLNQFSDPAEAIGALTSIYQSIGRSGLIRNFVADPNAERNAINAVAGIQVKAALAELDALKAAIAAGPPTLGSGAASGATGGFLSPQLAQIYTDPQYQGQIGLSSAGAQGFDAVPWLSQFGTGQSSAGSSWGISNFYIDYRATTGILDQVTALRAQGRFAEAEQLLRSTAPVHLGGQNYTLANLTPAFYQNLVAQFIGTDPSRAGVLSDPEVQRALAQAGVDVNALIAQFGGNAIVTTTINTTNLQQIAALTAPAGFQFDRGPILGLLDRAPPAGTDITGGTELSAFNIGTLNFSQTNLPIFYRGTQVGTYNFAIAVLTGPAPTASGSVTNLNITGLGAPWPQSSITGATIPFTMQTSAPFLLAIGTGANCGTNISCGLGVVVRNSSTDRPPTSAAELAKFVDHQVTVQAPAAPPSPNETNFVGVIAKSNINTITRP